MQYPCVIITGKGQPDLGTRQFAAKVEAALDIPVFALVDCDPHGIKVRGPVGMDLAHVRNEDACLRTCPRLYTQIVALRARVKRVIIRACEPSLIGRRVLRYRGEGQGERQQIDVPDDVGEQADTTGACLPPVAAQILSVYVSSSKNMSYDR